jgi:beta-glucosidase
MTALDQHGRLGGIDLLAELTLEEKASLLDGSDFWRTQPVERLGVPGILLTDGPHGLRKQTAATDHLGLSDSVPATCFPPAAGLASSWDVGLFDRVGRALGAESRAEGVGVLLGPGVNMKRTPLCGRNFEYLSEDPFLAGRLAAAWVQGVQAEGIGTSLKHFAANNQETERLTVSAQVDERTLREIYLAAFEHVVKDAQPWTVMCSYNRINGVYASQDPWLLTTVLREEWGFDGLVVSDWGAVDDRVAGVAAGLDLEMPTSGGVGTAAILKAVRDGRLTEAEVDVAAARVLALLERVRPALEAAPPVDVDVHHALAREAACASAVLLSNDGVLPLDASAGGTIAVIGELARTPRYQGAGSSRVNPTRLDDALAALRNVVPDREITFAPGYLLDDAVDETLLAEAVEQARQAEVVLLFLGLPPSYESEGFDREHLDLPAQQVALLDAVVAVNKDVVVVLSNGAVVTMPWRHQVRAVLECWLLGQAGGAAVADLLVGNAVPRGKLAETIPLRYLDTPAVGAFPGEHNEVVYREGLLIGYRWYDSRDLDVAFPFGHGLSYTTFGYSDLDVVVLDPEAGEVEVGITVTNTGACAGVEVVQVYVADPACSVFRPEQELKGFATVELAPGESRRVTLLLDSRAFSWWHAPQQRWIVEGGTFEVRVGASSRDVRARAELDLPGNGSADVPTPGSPVSRWLEHPVSGPVLLERLGDGPFGQMLRGEDHGRILGSFPMARLCRFPGFPVEEQELPSLLGTT